MLKGAQQLQAQGRSHEVHQREVTSLPSSEPTAVTAATDKGSFRRHCCGGYLLALFKTDSCHWQQRTKGCSSVAFYSDAIVVMARCNVCCRKSRKARWTSG